MDNIGPDLEILTHRLLETPVEFLAEPRIGTSGAIHVAALVFDLLRAHSISALPETLMHFQSANGRADRNRLALAAIAVWLLAAEWFSSIEIAQQDILEVLESAATELAAATAAHKFVSDPDRREELVRVVLARLHYRPAGETPAQAIDRLSSISGTERQRLLQASHAAEQRARQIREALARKAAQESADKWSRE
jgi:hypothetical protein